MALSDPGTHVLVRFLFRRGLALVYLVAFLVAATQFRALAGEEGLLPLGPRLERRSLREAPGLFQFVRSDRAVGAAAWLGVGLAALALLGLPARFGSLAAGVVWGSLWLLYLSFVNAGGSFYGFGWESMLLETGFLAIFLGGADVGTPVLVLFLLRWTLFRNMFGAGLIKLRGDDCWRDLTCMEYHYETQPMPNPLSWYAHHLPLPVHRAAVVVNHVVELVVPFLYFAPQPFAAIAGVATICFQAWLSLTGNFSWLNLLTAVLAVSTLSDGFVGALLPVEAWTVAPVPTPLWAAVLVLTAVVIVLSVRPAQNMVSSEQAMNASFDPLHLVNTYGAFGSITRTRYEVVVEGTDDEVLTGDTQWREYGFPGKPDDPARRPPQVAPFHHRLGWQLWFAAMSPSPRRHPWFGRLLSKLLAGDERVESLLASNPFPEEPPAYVRAVRYRYRFTTPEERRETGRWWHRERVGTYVPPTSTDDHGQVAGRSRFRQA